MRVIRVVGLVVWGFLCLGIWWFGKALLRIAVVWLGIGHMQPRQVERVVIGP
jgi:hypothetical protein